VHVFIRSEFADEVFCKFGFNTLLLNFCADFFMQEINPSNIVLSPTTDTAASVLTFHTGPTWESTLWSLCCILAVRNCNLGAMLACPRRLDELSEKGNVVIVAWIIVFALKKAMRMELNAVNNWKCISFCKKTFYLPSIDALIVTHTWAQSASWHQLWSLRIGILCSQFLLLDVLYLFWCMMYSFCLLIMLKKLTKVVGIPSSVSTPKYQNQGITFTKCISQGA